MWPASGELDGCRPRPVYGPGGVALFERVWVDRRPDAARDGQGWSDQKERVATVGRTVLGQLVQREDLTQRQAHVRDRADVKRAPERRKLGWPHLHGIVVGGDGGDLFRMHPG